MTLPKRIVLLGLLLIYLVVGPIMVALLLYWPFEILGALYRPPPLVMAIISAAIVGWSADGLWARETHGNRSVARAIGLAVLALALAGYVALNTFGPRI